MALGSIQSSTSSGLLNTKEVIAAATNKNNALPNSADLTEQRTWSESTVVKISAAAQTALSQDSSTGVTSALETAKVEARNAQPKVSSAASVSKAAAAFYANMAQAGKNGSSGINTSA